MKACKLCGLLVRKGEDYTALIPIHRECYYEHKLKHKFWSKKKKGAK